MKNKYVTKPVLVEAIQFDGTNIEEIKEFAGDKVITECWNRETSYYIAIRTLEGVMEALAGDYIIKGIKGEIYPCKPDIFEKTYEKVEEDPPEYPQYIKSFDDFDSSFGSYYNSYHKTFHFANHSSFTIFVAEPYGNGIYYVHMEDDGNPESIIQIGSTEEKEEVFKMINKFVYHFCAIEHTTIKHTPSVIKMMSL